MHVFPRTGETATSIATDGNYDIPQFPIEVKNVVRAFVYMDSVFFAADVKCGLVHPDNDADERTLHEEGILRRQGELRKLRPCVVTGRVDEGGATHYRLCPMAGFHEEGGSRKRYKDLKAPTSLLVRPVEAIDCTETFGDYTGYQFTPKWHKGPQYLFPIEVSREDIFVANHRLLQSMDSESFGRLLEDIKKVPDVWKKWRKAEHIVESKEELPVFKSEWDPLDRANLSRTQWKAYPLRKNRRGGGAMDHNKYLKLTANIEFKRDTNEALPSNKPTDDLTLSATPKEGRVPLAGHDALLFQDGRRPLHIPPPPYPADLPAPNPSRALYGSKEVPDSHPTVPSHMVPAPSPRVTPLLTKKDIPATEITLQSPHGEHNRHLGDFIQGHKAAGTTGGATPELEGPSDMDTSTISNASSLRLKKLARCHSLQSSEGPTSPSLVRQDLVTPKVEDKPSQSSQHLSKDGVESLHHNPKFLPESDRIPVHEPTLSEASKVESVMLDGEPSVASWKTISGGVKRARSPEGELSAANPRLKRQRMNRN